MTSPLIDGTGRTIPVALVRGAFLVLAGALVLTEVSSDAWALLCALLTVCSVLAPRWLLAWVLIAALAVGQLFHRAQAGDWHPYVLLAGLVALHLLAAQLHALPLGARLALRVLARPALRMAVLTASAEVLLALALLLDAPARGAALVPAAVIGGAALVALAVLLFLRPLAARD